MDWVTFTAVVLTSLVSGGLIVGLLGWRLDLWKFRHQKEQDDWAAIQASYEKQIDSAEKRSDKTEVERVRKEFEAQQEAWRAQQGVEALAPKHIGSEKSSTLTMEEVELLRELLMQSEELSVTALSAEDHLLRGNAYYEVEGYKDAVDSYSQALRLRPEYPEAYNNRGVAYDRLGEHQKALEDYNEALHLGPKDPEVYNNRGVTHRGIGEHQKALEDYNEALRLWPEYPEVYINRGVAHSDLGEHQKALEDYNEALRLRPDHV